MQSFHEIAPTDIPGNVFDMIGKRWMLVTAGSPSAFNTMTASWGGLGILWERPVAFCFIRPQRYTLGFLEKSDRYTLSFYDDEKYRKALNICGSKSGRDCDKVREAGLTPAFVEGTVYFEQASLVLVCRKLAARPMDPSFFLDPAIEKYYPQKDYHKIFVGAIEKVLTK